MAVDIVQAVTSYTAQGRPVTVRTRDRGQEHVIEISRQEVSWFIRTSCPGCSLVAEMGPAPRIDAWALEGPALSDTRAEPYGDGIVRLCLCGGDDTRSVIYGIVDLDPMTVASVSSFIPPTREAVQ